MTALVGAFLPCGIPVVDAVDGGVGVANPPVLFMTFSPLNPVVVIGVVFDVVAVVVELGIVEAGREDRPEVAL